MDSVWVVQYYCENGVKSDIGGVHMHRETAEDEVQKNGYTYIDSNLIDVGYLYHRENGKRCLAGFAEIVNRAVVDRIKEEY